MMLTGLEVLLPTSMAGVLTCILLIFMTAASLCASQPSKKGERQASEQQPGDDGLVVCRCEADFLAAARSQRAGEAVLFIRQGGAAA